MTELTRLHIYGVNNRIEKSSDGVFCYFEDVKRIVVTCGDIQEHNKQLIWENGKLNSMVKLLEKENDLLLRKK